MELPLIECPKCGFKYSGVPALSREDNKTLICSDCGVIEALSSIGITSEDEIDKTLRLVKRYELQNRD